MGAGAWVESGISDIGLGASFGVVPGVTVVTLGNSCPLEMFTKDVAAKICANDGADYQHEKHDAKHPRRCESYDLLDPFSILSGGYTFQIGVACEEEWDDSSDEDKRENGVSGNEVCPASVVSRSADEICKRSEDEGEKRYPERLTCSQNKEAYQQSHDCDHAELVHSSEEKGERDARDDRNVERTEDLKDGDESAELPTEGYRCEIKHREDSDVDEITRC